MQKENLPNPEELNTTLFQGGPKKITFKTQDEITSSNKKKREEILMRLNQYSKN